MACPENRANGYTRRAPLSPLGHSHPAADPVIQIAALLIAVGDPKVVDPATNKRAGFKALIPHADPPVPVGKFPYTLLEFSQRLRVPLDLSAPEGEA